MNDTELEDLQRARKEAQQLEGHPCSVYMIFLDGTGGTQPCKSLRAAIFEAGFLNTVNDDRRFRAWVVRNQ